MSPAYFTSCKISSDEMFESNNADIHFARYSFIKLPRNI